MHRVAACFLVFIGLAIAGCLLSSYSPLLAQAGLPESVAVDDGKGNTLDLRLAAVVEGGQLVSGFGWRDRHPMGGGGASHAGIDIKAPRGTPVRAAAPGTIVEISWGSDFGRFVRLKHGERLETVYAHLTRVTKPLKIGDEVTPEDIIGYVGSTGRSTGPHLHLEVRRNGKPIDPLGIKRTRATKARSTTP
jgi:murein DD-endopeptidase MepM/ murein hydrolase activator NlpD